MLLQLAAKNSFDRRFCSVENMNLELYYLVASMVFQMVWKVTVQGIFLTFTIWLNRSLKTF